MRSSYGYELARDRQSQLLHDAGVDNPSAYLLAEMAARKRAETAADRSLPKPAKRFGGVFLGVRLRRARPGLAGV